MEADTLSYVVALRGYSGGYASRPAPHRALRGPAHASGWEVHAFAALTISCITGCGWSERFFLWLRGVLSDFVLYVAELWCAVCL